MKCRNVLTLLLLMVAGVAPVQALSTFITDFSTTTGTKLSKWTTFETEGSPVWYVNGPAMTRDAESYIQTESGTDYAHIVWDKTNHGPTWYSLSMAPVAVGPGTTAEIRYRAFAADTQTTPNLSLRLSAWGQDAGGMHSWHSIIQGPAQGNGAWVVEPLDLTNELVVGYFTLTLFGGSANTAYGIDIDYIKINGVEIPQLDPLGGGPGTNWGQRDLAGWGHGNAKVVNAGGTYGNVGEFTIFSGDPSDAVFISYHAPQAKWANAVQTPYLHFDWRLAPGTNPSDVFCNVRIFGDNTLDARFISNSDESPGVEWEHKVYDMTDPSFASYTSIFGIYFALIDFLDATSSPRLIGIQVDNIQFTDSDTLPTTGGVTRAGYWTTFE